MSPDFRSEAAAATLPLMHSAPGTGLGDLGQSGCLAVPGGRRIQYLVGMPTLLISAVCLLIAVLVPILTGLGVIARRLFYPLVLGNLGVTLVLRKVKFMFVKAYVSTRSGSLLKAFPRLPRLTVGIEDGKTVSNLKLIIEDEGVCLPDAEHQRLLIEGCCYRYVIYGRDVTSIEPIARYAMSGARVSCRLAGQDVELAIMVRGHGPLASLTQAFDPSSGAVGLASALNHTLFALHATTYNKAAGAPPVIDVSRGRDR